LLAASLLATIPVWIPEYPAMCDLPQHAAQVALLRALHHSHFAYSGMFQVNWFTPYLSGYAPLYLLTPLLGIVLAGKVVVALALAALPLSTALVMRETGTNPYWALLTIPALYGFNFQWGLLNFLVATPLGMVFLWLVLRHLRSGSVRSSLGLAVLLNLLFFCHALICVFFGMIAAGYIVLEKKPFLATVRSLAPLAAVLPTMALWLHKTISNPLHTKSPIIWNLGWFNTDSRFYYGSNSWVDRAHPGMGRINGFVPRLLGTRPDAVWTIYAIVVFSLPFLAGARPGRRLKAWLPLLLCAGVLLFVPDMAFDSAFLHARFTVLVLPFFLMAFQTGSGLSAPQSAQPGKLSVNQPTSTGAIRRYATVGLATVLMIFWVGVVSVRALEFDQTIEGFNVILSQMQPGQRVLSLMGVPEDNTSIAPTLLHFPAWYSALKGGVVDPSFANFLVELVVYRPAVFHDVPHGFELHPQMFDWQKTGGDKFRYFVVRTPVDPGGFLSKSAPCPVRFLYQQNDWWLFERDLSCKAGSALSKQQ
jgi:hypothetical protein